MMNTKTMRKAARDLVPGDVLMFDDKGRRVVTLARPSSSPNHISVSCVVLGAYEEGVRISHFPLDSQFTVEAPAGLTPVQAAADKLLDMLRDTHAICKQKGWQHYGRMDIDALLDELDPPKPPTLDEALILLRKFESDSLTQENYDLALVETRALLKRVPD